MFIAIPFITVRNAVSHAVTVQMELAQNTTSTLTVRFAESMSKLGLAIPVSKKEIIKAESLIENGQALFAWKER